MVCRLWLPISTQLPHYYYTTLLHTSLHLFHQQEDQTLLRQLSASEWRLNEANHGVGVVLDGVALCKYFHVHHCWHDLCWRNAYYVPSHSCFNRAQVFLHEVSLYSCKQTSSHHWSTSRQSYPSLSLSCPYRVLCQYNLGFGCWANLHTKDPPFLALWHHIKQQCPYSPLGTFGLFTQSLQHLDHSLRFLCWRGPDYLQKEVVKHLAEDP